MNSTDNRQESVTPDEMYQVLIQEINTCQSLIKVMRDMQETIIKGDIIHLQAATAKEQSLIKKANELTELRLSMLKHLYLAEGIHSRPISLKGYIMHSTQSLDIAWTEIDNQLTQSSNEIRRLNEENKRLLEVSLGFIKEIIRRLYNHQDKNSVSVYSEDGSVSKKYKESSHLNVNV